MKLSEFNFFTLSDENIALKPPYHRDECKLMVVHRKSETIEMFQQDASGKYLDGSNGEDKQYLQFKNVLDYFHEGDTFILNDTKVFPARLYGTKEKTDAEIEVFLLRELNARLKLWDVLVEPARKIRIGNKLFFNENSSIMAEVVDNTTSRGRTLRFLYDCDHDDFKKALYAMGKAPLPEYLTRLRETDDEDQEDFQCIFAKNEGAVTVPASGIHFSREMMKRMEIRDINTAFVTLHTSLASFNEIEVEDLSKHKTESEQMYIGSEACRIINETRDRGNHLIAVGTGAMRAIETAVGTDGYLKEFDGWTSKFIFPPYRFSLADSMICNFYHPLSTLLMTQCAFGGFEIIKEAYLQALDNDFKFGCYGDAMLIVND